MQDDGLYFVPLGGAGEIGQNLYLYGQAGRWMMVDCGIGFADDTLPGADILVPDPSFAEERRDALDGIVLTHAHEDHYGAVAHLWPRLGCPVYCTRFTAAVLRTRLADANLLRKVEIRVVEPGETFGVGPFECRFLHVTHSIPEANALAIRTVHGTLLHSGDWKLDPEPLLGETTDTAGLEALGADGVLALIADSTNVFTPGTSGSEAEVKDSLRELLKDQPGRIALTSFASNVARLQTAIEVGHELGREIVLVGRSIRRMVEAAREVGYLKDLPPVVDERDAMDIPRDRALFVVTGSQGEPRAALTRIASGAHPNVKLEPGDTVVFSAKIIPGNERTLYDLHNLLVRKGIEVITEEDHFVHVSGHPCRDELEQLYRWVRPRILVPVHGEARHLHEHALFARSRGVPIAIEVHDGDLLRLAPGDPRVVDQVHTGRLVIDNGDVVLAEDDRFRTRRRLMAHGTVLVGIVLDGYGSVVAPPQTTTLGTLDLAGDRDRHERVIEEITDAVEALGDREVAQDERVREAVRGAVRRAGAFGRERRPIIEVQVTRLSAETMAALEDDVETAG